MIIFVDDIDKDCVDMNIFHCLHIYKIHTVKSLEFKVVQFLWYMWVALIHEFTPSTKTNYKRFSFLIATETENRHIHEITSPRITKKPTTHENWPPRN